MMSFIDPYPRCATHTTAASHRPRPFVHGGSAAFGSRRAPPRCQNPPQTKNKRKKIIYKSKEKREKKRNKQILLAHAHVHAWPRRHNLPIHPRTHLSPFPPPSAHTRRACVASGPPAPSIHPSISPSSLEDDHVRRGALHLERGDLGVDLPVRHDARRVRLDVLRLSLWFD